MKWHRLYKISFTFTLSTSSPLPCSETLLFKETAKLHSSLLYRSKIYITLSIWHWFVVVSPQLSKENHSQEGRICSVYDQEYLRTKPIPLKFLYEYFSLPIRCDYIVMCSLGEISSPLGQESSNVISMEDRAMKGSLLDFKRLYCIRGCSTSFFSCTSLERELT